METIKVDVESCARCGNPHTALNFRKFKQHSIGEYDYWALCPKLKEPILMQREYTSLKPVSVSDNPIKLYKLSRDELVTILLRDGITADNLDWTVAIYETRDGTFKAGNRHNLTPTTNELYNNPAMPYRACENVGFWIWMDSVNKYGKLVDEEGYEFAGKVNLNALRELLREKATSKASDNPCCVGQASDNP